jgi:hypothetical protein
MLEPTFSKKSICERRRTSKELDVLGTLETNIQALKALVVRALNDEGVMALGAMSSMDFLEGGPRSYR